MILVSSKNKECSCVGKHIPLPSVLVEVVLADKSLVYVCPTTYHNLVQFQRLRNPPGSVRKHFSDYVQRIAPLLDNHRPGC